MDFVSKKTTELNEKELQEIASLFSSVFTDHESRSTEYLLNQYTQNALGASFHTFMYENGVLVGHIAGVPGYYCLNGKRLLAVNPVDLMIEEKHRGLQGFMFLIKKAWAYYKEQGVQLIFNLPNNNSHPLFIKLKCVKSIGSLYTYVLPYRIGGVVSSLKLFNVLSMLFSKAWVTISGWFASNKSIGFSVQRDYNSFIKTRYMRSDGNYSFGEAEGVKFVYKIMDYDGKRTAFLIDVYEKSQKAFCNAVKYLIKHEGRNFDLILYVGYLPFVNPGLIRIPHKYEPKNFNFDGIILNDDGITDIDKTDYYNIAKWDINLSDDDII